VVEVYLKVAFVSICLLVRINALILFVSILYISDLYRLYYAIMAPTVAFVTGANRGLGFGLVKHFVAISNYVSYLFQTIYARS
jgi:norsolorinic acid ketoreductase